MSPFGGAVCQGRGAPVRSPAARGRRVVGASLRWRVDVNISPRATGQVPPRPAASGVAAAMGRPPRHGATFSRAAECAARGADPRRPPGPRGRPFESLEASSQQPDEDAGPDVVSQARQMGEVLQAAILVLPEAYREVLVLRDVEGLSTEEASEVVGIGERALKSRLHRARMELRGHLATLMGEASPDA